MSAIVPGVDLALENLADAFGEGFGLEAATDLTMSALAYSDQVNYSLALLTTAGKGTGRRRA